MAEGSAHVRQAPWQAPSQQTPSTQKPLEHSVAPAQAWPFGFLPQLPFWQTLGATQSVSAAQRFTQAALAHW